MRTLIVAIVILLTFVGLDLMVEKLGYSRVILA
jgi:hypothetical protein